MENEQKDGGARAIDHCKNSKTAVTLLMWPAGYTQVAEARKFLLNAGARILYESTLGPFTSEMEQIKLVMGIYAGEEWLKTNCWYFESPLPAGKPKGPFPGAKWKQKLCFKNGDKPLHVFVADVADANVNVWDAKYQVRQSMANATGNDGNVCMHLSDNQAEVIGLKKGLMASSTGYGCDSSYAYHTCRMLLNPFSLEFLRRHSDISDLSENKFLERFETYTKWLSDTSWVDFENLETGCKWNRPSFME